MYHLSNVYFMPNYYCHKIRALNGVFKAHFYMKCGVDLISPWYPLEVWNLQFPCRMWPWSMWCAWLAWLDMNVTADHLGQPPGVPKSECAMYTMLFWFVFSMWHHQFIMYSYDAFTNIVSRCFTDKVWHDWWLRQSEWSNSWSYGGWT